MLRELVLEVDPEVHVFHRVDHDVDELHARHLEDGQELLHPSLNTERSNCLCSFYKYILQNIINIP